MSQMLSVKFARQQININLGSSIFRLNISFIILVKVKEKVKVLMYEYHCVVLFSF